MRNRKETEHQPGREWYLFHYPVMNPNKAGKVRRVLNGSSKFQGLSSNKVLLNGPDLLQNLIHTLISFRQHQFFVSADIEEMFGKVCCHLINQLSVLCGRRTPQRPLKCISGTKESPTCPNYAL